MKSIRFASEQDTSVRRAHANDEKTKNDDAVERRIVEKREEK